MNMILAFLIAILVGGLVGGVVRSLAGYLGLKSSSMLSAVVSAFVAVMVNNYLAGRPVAKNPADGIEVLSVGVSADFPPFTFLDQGKLVGFEIDLMDEIGKRLDLAVAYRNTPFGTLLPALQLGNLQVVAAGLTETPERAQHVLFTKPYLENNPLVIVSSKSQPIGALNELGNKEVVVNEGYTADLYLSKLGNLSILRLKTPAEAFLALRSGRATAFVTARDTVKPFFDQYGADEFSLVEIPGTNESCSLAITPRQPDLRAKIQQVIDAMQKDGTLTDLKKKWGLA